MSNRNRLIRLASAPASALLVASVAVGPVSAGPNAGGVLIVHTDPTVEYTDDLPFCDVGQVSAPASCEEAITRIDGVDPAVWWVLASFPNGSSPRLAGVAFGIEYPSDVVLLEQQYCGDFNLPENDWPNSGRGTAMTWTEAQTDQIVLIYSFAGYNYGASGAFSVIDHPQGGANFADDDIPSVIDPVVAFGSLGFNMDGGNPCEQGEWGACCRTGCNCLVISRVECGDLGGTYQGDGTVCDPNPCCPPTGACCFQDGSCEELTEQECADEGGTFTMSESCDPNPCETTPTVETSWGQIKLTDWD